MKKLLLILLVAYSTYSQGINTYMGGDGFKYSFVGSRITPVLTIDTTMPLTPYGNGWVIFRGTSHRQFMKTADLDFLEFPIATTDSFRIQTKVKFGTRKSMWICGKANWIIAFNSSTANKISFIFTGGAGWIPIKSIATTDTSTWHTIDIKYTKANTTMLVLVDDSTAYNNSSYSYTSPANIYSFSVGQGGMATGMSDPSFGNSLDASSFFDGSMDYMYIHTWGSLQDSVIYDFNEGSGQYAYDKGTYLTYDRTFSDNTSSGHHLLSGVFSNIDSQDVTWSKGVRTSTTDVTTLGTGLWMWAGSGNSWWQESFTNGQTILGTKYVFTAQFNRVNVPANTFTHSGDTAYSVCYWNGTGFSKFGTNGSWFTGTVTQAFADGDTLYVGGGFFNAGGLANADNVAIFKGVIWDTLSKGLNSDVFTFGKHNGFVYAGGGFTASGSTTIYKVAKWNYGSWSAVGTINFCNYVWALESYNGSLYAGTDIGLFKFNGTQWDSVAGTSGKYIYDLDVLKGDLWITGINVLGKYNGSTYTSMGTMSGNVSHGIAMAHNSKDLYLVGSFHRIIYNGTNTVAKMLARWNGVAWSAVNYGIPMRPEDISYIDETHFLISGDFYSIDGIDANNVAVITVP